jgi:uncharacterized Zn-binding protein involved in type VI secretion
MITLLPKVSLLLVAIIGLVAPSLSAATVSQPASPKKIIGPPTQPANQRGDVPPKIQISLSFPAGKSPKVFTDGWVFGAVAISNPGTREQRDISGDVRWKGTGTFNPDRGPMSRPSFNGPGTNRITLYIERDGKAVVEKTFTIEAVDPKGYAQVGSMVRCPNYALGCPGCPHNVVGKIMNGSSNVRIGGLPAARVGDKGASVGGCGPNVVTVKTGDPSVLIDGKPAARVGDKTQFDGGMGVIETGYGGR